MVDMEVIEIYEIIRRKIEQKAADCTQILFVNPFVILDYCIYFNKFNAISVSKL